MAFFKFIECLDWEVLFVSGIRAVMASQAKLFPGELNLLKDLVLKVRDLPYSELVIGTILIKWYQDAKRE